MRDGIGSVIAVWLPVGVLATWQQACFATSSTNCAAAGAIAPSVFAGQPSYGWVKPKVAECNVPQPSS